MKKFIIIGLSLLVSSCATTIETTTITAEVDSVTSTVPLSATFQKKGRKLIISAEGSVYTWPSKDAKILGTKIQITTEEAVITYE